MGWFIDGFPKTFGNPKQVRVDDIKTLYKYIDLNNSKDCYLSVNSYPNWTTSNIRHIQNVMVSKLFFDFDSDNLEVAFNDLRTLYYYLIDDMSIIPVFSGNKGFHLYVLLKPEIYTVGSKLKQMLYTSHKFFEHLGFETSDVHVYSDYKRISRIPYTINTKSGLYSYVMSEKDMDKSIDELINKARKKPDIIDVDDKRRTVTLKEFSKIYEYELKENMVFKPISIDNVGLADRKYYEKLFEYYPCVFNDLLSKSPSHVSRFQGVVWLKWLGFSMEDIVLFYDELAKNWNDRHNVDMRHYQIYQIYTQYPEYKLYQCKTFIENGICTKCKRFRGDYDEYNS